MVSHPISAIAARTGNAPRIAAAERIGSGGARPAAQVALPRLVQSGNLRLNRAIIRGMSNWQGAMTLWLRKRLANYDGYRRSAPASFQIGELSIAREELFPCSDRVRAEQIRILYRTGPVGVVGAAVAALVLAGLLQSVGSSALLGTAVWLICLVLVVAGHLALCRRYWRAAPADMAWRPWARWFMVFSAAEGTIWGVASMALTTPGQLDQHLLVLLVAATITSGAVAAYGSYLPAFYALLFPAIVPYGIASVGLHGLFDRAIAMLVPIYIVAIAALAVRINANFLETLRLRFENLDLVQELRIQKEVAEQANVAKSSFLAAASHDLRQPVHALGMFVGALQGHAMNDEMRRLVEHIGSSVNAMDGLFNSLLDISRLDAGVVDTHIEAFPIQPLLVRVCRDYTAESQAKGLRLVLHPCSAIVRTDQVLIERILDVSSSAAVIKTGSASRYGTPGAASLWKSRSKCSRSFIN
jgi:hypothetical protein